MALALVPSTGDDCVLMRLGSKGLFWGLLVLQSPRGPQQHTVQTHSRMSRFRFSWVRLCSVPPWTSVGPGAPASKLPDRSFASAS